MSDVFELEDKNWKNIKEDETGRPKITIPDGKYQAMIVDVSARESKTGLWQMNWKLKIADSGREGSIIFTNTPLEGEWLKITKKTVKACGFEPESMKELKKLIADEAFNSLLVEITLKTKGDNQNCFINKTIDILENKTENFVEETEEDDIPF